MSEIVVEFRGPVTLIGINRPDVRNAVDRPTAIALADAFRSFADDPSCLVAVLHGIGGTFCAGADLKAIAEGSERASRVETDGDGPMGPTRMTLDKPVIAAIEGHAVAGGLELAIWCDLRVAAEDATFGVFSRRWGVPLIDGGTVRLPRLVGHSRALDMIVTGRPVYGPEAMEIGLVDRLVGPGEALDAAVELAHEIARLPQASLRADRRSALDQWGLSMDEALRQEFARGFDAIGSGETQAGAEAFRAQKKIAGEASASDEGAGSSDRGARDESAPSSESVPN